METLTHFSTADWITTYCIPQWPHQFPTKNYQQHILPINKIRIHIWKNSIEMIEGKVNTSI